MKCEGICKRWIHQFCTGLKVMPKGKFIAKNVNKSSVNKINIKYIHDKYR